MSKKQLLFCLWAILASFSQAWAQDKQVCIIPTSQAILVDGQLQEAIWQQAPVADQFHMTFPFDTLSANSQTEVRLLSDDQFLYLGIHCQQSQPKPFVIQSLNRDFIFQENDAFAFYLDAFGDATHGFFFAINAQGVQSDGMITEAGNREISLDWDGLWYAEVNRQADHTWTAEIAIPLRTLRFTEYHSQWKVNFARNDRANNEVSSWVPVQRGFRLGSLNRMGILQWNQAPKAGNNKINLIPYSSTRIEQDKTQNNSSQLKSTVGLDAKIELSSSLHLDISINPDFSQVEVDKQVINLQRFEIFFPEKRLFFLENSDLFANLGNHRVHPFFSRRIGDAEDHTIPILAGIRLSGNLNKDWRVGLMSVHTEADQDGDTGQHSQNYSIATLQHTLTPGINLTAFMTNRQAFQDYYRFSQDYNRIGGLEFDYNSKDAKLTGKAFLHRAFSPEITNDQLAYSGKIRYRSRNFSLRLGLDHTDKNYITDVGFAPRLYHENPLDNTINRIAYTQLRAQIYYRFFAKKNSIIDYVEPKINVDYFLGDQREYQEHQIAGNWTVSFKNRSALDFKFAEHNPILFFPFALDGLQKSLAPGNYRNQRYTLQYQTGKKSAIFGNMKVGYGGLYVGDQFKFQTEWNYRIHHIAVLGFYYSYRQLLNFPTEFGEADFSLLGAKFRLSFNRALSWSTFLQYNTQKQNFSVNSRFSWRFSPLSDLYLVYTGNANSDDFETKNQTLVLKVNYWITR